MSSKEELRKLRAAEIARLTQEMMQTKPDEVFQSKSETVVESEETSPEPELKMARKVYEEDKLETKSSTIPKKSESANVVPSATSPRVEDDGSLPPTFPVSHQLDLGGHTKAVTCLTVDPSGNRVATGSLDYSIKMFDFGGMDSRGRFFRSFEATDGHPVVSVSYSPNGDRIVVGTGSCQPRVFDRDGNLLTTFVRGDMYINDQAQTKGHVMEVSGVSWHPSDADTVISSSLDGTVRIWNLKGDSAFGNLVNKHVLKLKSNVAGSGRLGATCCAYSRNTGKMIAAGGTDGSIHIWQEKKIYSRADHVIKGHPNSQVNSLVFSSDNTLLISRGEDACIKVWDVKRPQNPLKVITGVTNVYPSSNVALSPDDSLIVCGVSRLIERRVIEEVSAITAVSKKRVQHTAQSLLCFYDTKGNATEPKAQIGIPGEACVIAVAWVPSTNQILCSMSSGVTRTYYDPRVSKKGAMLAAGKAPRREKDPMDFAMVGEIVAPHALPLFRGETKDAQRKRKAEEREALVPQRPSNQGPGNRVNTSFFFTQYVTSGKAATSIRTEDPREALLKMDEKARSDPIFFGKAYQSSQPVNLLDNKTFEEEEEEFKKKQKDALN